MEQTVGEQRIRPEHRELSDSEKETIKTIKTKTIELIDICETLKSKDPRLASLAQTSFEQGSLWATKATSAK